MPEIFYFMSFYCLMRHQIYIVAYLLQCRGSRPIEICGQNEQKIIDQIVMGRHICTNTTCQHCYLTWFVMHIRFITIVVQTISKPMIGFFNHSQNNPIFGRHIPRRRLKNTSRKNINKLCMEHVKYRMHSAPPLA